MSKESVKIKLQGHEKFPLREGWINKGLIAVEQNPMIFQGKEGPDTLGIGNNMVKSLRYWMKAFGLITESSINGARLTPIGQIIWENDKYLEDDFTLWLLHSNIVRNKSEATSWYMYFNKCDADELSKDHIETILSREISEYAVGQTFSDKSLKSDIDILLGMYSKSRQVSDPEDKNISPFAKLGLIRNSNGKYSKKIPDRRCLSDWNILYEVLKIMDGENTISIEKVINDDNGLASIYQITSVMANEYLDSLDALGYITVQRTAGLDVIYKKTDIESVNVVELYYEKCRCN